MITWSEDFLTGSPIVDLQHKMLVEKINQLEELLKGPPPEPRVFEQLLDFFGTYIAAHFQMEERCMVRASCPAHERNAQAHAEFLQVFSGFKKRYFAEGAKTEILAALHAAAESWITNHILTIDIQLRSCIGK